MNGEVRGFDKPYQEERQLKLRPQSKVNRFMQQKVSATSPAELCRENCVHLVAQVGNVLLCVHRLQLQVAAVDAHGCLCRHAILHHESLQHRKERGVQMQCT